MATITFDTHDQVKRLIQAGLPEAQAEAVIDAVKQTTNLPDISKLATKDELTNTEVALKADIKAVKAELIWWILGTGVVSTVAHLFIK